MRTTRNTQTAQMRRSRGARHAARRPKLVLAADARLRSNAPNEDSALHVCDCGHAFQAEPSTTVACPRCGTGQAW